MPRKMYFDFVLFLYLNKYINIYLLNGKIIILITIITIVRNECNIFIIYFVYLSVHFFFISTAIFYD